jgi:hypothetical protein
MNVGDKVVVRWTNCNRQYDGRGVLPHPVAVSNDRPYRDLTTLPGGGSERKRLIASVGTKAPVVSSA